MTDFTQTAHAYLAAWNQTDGSQRLPLVEATFAPGCTYVDPMAAVEGAAAVSGLIGAVQDQFPGFVFSLVGTPDGHHDQVRFRWGLGPAGADPVVIGFDVARLDDDGRFAQVLGFLDQVPAA